MVCQIASSQVVFVDFPSRSACGTKWPCFVPGYFARTLVQTVVEYDLHAISRSYRIRRLRLLPAEDALEDLQAPPCETA